MPRATAARDQLEGVAQAPGADRFDWGTVWRRGPHWEGQCCRHGGIRRCRGGWNGPDRSRRIRGGRNRRTRRSRRCSERRVHRRQFMSDGKVLRHDRYLSDRCGRSAVAHAGEWRPGGALFVDVRPNPQGGRRVRAISYFKPWPVRRRGDPRYLHWARGRSRIKRDEPTLPGALQRNHDRRFERKVTAHSVERSGLSKRAGFFPRCSSSGLCFAFGTFLQFVTLRGCSTCS
jgi:hypothetical protein